MNNAKPLLSICIPTYNRAELLRSALRALIPQILAAQGEAELVVSDNCSPDRTPEVVAWAREQFQESPELLLAHRNEENIGGGRNFMQSVQVLARGEFAWIMGDDDIVHQGAIQDVLQVLKAQPNIDYVFVNNCYEPDGRREEAERLGGIQNSKSCARDSLQDQRVEKWERIIGLTGKVNLFTFIGNHVMRTELWRREPVNFATDVGFPSMMATFPHAAAVARQMMGRPACYLGRPRATCFTGAQDFSAFWPMIQMVRIMELADYFGALGMESSMLRVYRNRQLQKSSDSFWKLMTDRSTPGRDFFHLKPFVRAHWKSRGFWELLTRYPLKRWVRAPLLKVLNALRRKNAEESAAKSES